MEGSNLQPPVALCALPSLVSEEAPVAQQHVWLIKQEHIQLKSDFAFWKAQHRRSVEREKALQKELEEARAEIWDLRQRLYGRKSEKAAPRDDRSFTGGNSSRPRGQQKGAKGHGRAARPQLPIEEEVQDLPAGTPCCAICHQPFVEIFRTEDSDVIEVQVRAHVRRIKRKMYRRGCRCEQSPGLITAPLPPRLLPRNPLGPSAWVEVLLPISQKPTKPPPSTPRTSSPPSTTSGSGKKRSPGRVLLGPVKKPALHADRKLPPKEACDRYRCRTGFLPTRG
jgi:hypothetical protein